MIKALLLIGSGLAVGATGYSVYTDQQRQSEMASQLAAIRLALAQQQALFATAATEQVSVLKAMHEIMARSDARNEAARQTALNQDKKFHSDMEAAIKAARQ